MNAQVKVQGLDIWGNIGFVQCRIPYAPNGLWTTEGTDPVWQRCCRAMHSCRPVISEPPSRPFKSLNIRIPIITPIRERGGGSNHGSTLESRPCWVMGSLPSSIFTF